MAFYTGSANSFADILSAFSAALVSEGWNLSNGIHSKSGAYVLLTAHATNGITVRGGIGQSGSNLIDASDIQPRAGRPSSFGVQPNWPMAYFFHIFDEPDEVYLVARFNVDCFYFLAFGMSDVAGLTGSGLWLTATSRQLVGSFNGQDGFVPNETGGGVANDRQSTGMPFWDTVRYLRADLCQDAVHALAGWCPPTTQLNAVQYAAPHIQRSPNAWNGDAVLLPIQVYQSVAESKVQLVVDIRHARYLRIDNYDPGAVITLGDDRWMVYPGFRKDSVNRSTGTAGAAAATGTFGWCIRYDGP